MLLTYFLLPLILSKRHRRHRRHTVRFDELPKKGPEIKEETYSRIGLLRSYGNLQWYWTTTKLVKLTVVLDYYEAMETYSRIGLLRSYGTYGRIEHIGAS